MGAQERELRRQLDWLMTFRVVIITTLMVSAFVIELMYRPLLSLQPFYVIAVVTYAMTIAYALMSRTLRAIPPQIYAQLLGDLLVVTGFVYLTGGAASPFSFLYLLSIIIGSILLVRRGGFLVAAGSWLMYASMILLVQRGVIPPTPAGSEEGEAATVRILYSLVAHLVSFFAVAYLASYLTENLRRTGRELQMRRDDLAQLRDYNDNIIDSMNSGLLTTDARERSRSPTGVPSISSAGRWPIWCATASWRSSASVRSSWTACGRRWRGRDASAPSWTTRTAAVARCSSAPPSRSCGSATARPSA
jgi:two-component system, NtrC family, sensor histidine kinase PilS